MLIIVPEPVAPAWASIPEYTVHAPVAAPPTPAPAPEAKSADAAQETESSPEGSTPAQAGKE
jgi:hypothetical protein